MKKFVVANWKAQLSPEQVDNWLQDFSSGYRPASSIRVVLAVPFLYMKQVAKTVAKMKKVDLAAQGVSPYPPGSYTGATPAAWLKGLSRYALIGHQERCRYFHEDTVSLAGQVRESVAAGLQPILCLDRKNKSGRLAALDTSDLEQTMLAYTPSDAVTLELAVANQDIIDRAAAFAASSNGCPVLYGGGVNKDNAAELINLDGIAGIMVGRSCLDGAGFAKLVNNIS